jgi:hypothetical protein
LFLLLLVLFLYLFKNLSSRPERSAFCVAQWRDLRLLVLFACSCRCLFLPLFLFLFLFLGGSRGLQAPESASIQMGFSPGPLPLLVPFACSCRCLFLLSEGHGFSRAEKAQEEKAGFSP